MRGGSGKTQNEIAFSLMKLVSEVAGKEPRIVGLSTLDNLNGIRTEPVIDVLRHTNWKEFFKKYSKDSFNQSLKEQNPFQEKFENDFGLFDSAPQAYALHASKKETHHLANSVEECMQRLKRRVSSLWTELKIPSADRSFYSSCFDKKGTFHQCQEISKYISALLEHRSRTIRCLYAISAREIVFERCFVKIEEIKACDLEAIRSQIEDDLKTILTDLQEATYDVCLAIKDWRAQLWRPMPFMYKGQNYMFRIIDDLDYLSNVLEANILPTNLLNNWILLIKKSSSEIPQVPQGSGEAETETKLNEEFEGIAVDDDENGFRNGKSMFNRKSDPEDLLKMQKYLENEDLMQRTVAVEQKYLAENKVFIPLIKYSNIRCAADEPMNTADVNSKRKNETTMGKKEQADALGFHGDSMVSSGSLELVNKVSLVDKLRQEISTKTKSRSPNQGEPKKRFEKSKKR